MLNKHLSNLNDLYELLTLPFQLINANAEELEVFPQDFPPLYNRKFLLDLLEKLNTSNPVEGILIYQLKELYYCAITLVDKNTFLITAPISTSSTGSTIDFESFIPFLKAERLPVIKRIMTYLPVVSTNQLAKFAKLSRRQCDNKTPVEVSIFHTENLLLSKEVELRTHLEEKLVPQRHHNRDYNDRLTQAIINGDADTYIREQSRPVIGKIGQMSLIPLRQARYRFICAVYSISRAAIIGGLANEYSLQLSDMYCRKMDTLNKVEEINALILTMSVDYCNKVKSTKQQKDYSNYTKIVIEYIRNHLYEKIRVDGLTFEASLNKRSLSIYFKNDTGLSIPDYITQKKLEEAKLLLKTTNYSISQISEMLTFSSQSYFGKKYKEHFGLTPQKFRDSIVE